MEQLLYNDEIGKFRLVDEFDLLEIRNTFEEPSDDDEYLAEFDELERHGWRGATPLTVAMALGDVHDEKSLAAWQARRSQRPDSLSDTDNLADAVRQLTQVHGAGVFILPAQALANFEVRIVSKSIPERTSSPTTSTPTIDPEALYTALEAAQRLRCGKTNVYDLWDSGELAVTRTGTGKRGMRVSGADLIHFLQSRRSGGPAPKVRYKHLKSLD